MNSSDLVLGTFIRSFRPSIEPPSILNVTTCSNHESDNDVKPAHQIDSNDSNKRKQQKKKKQENNHQLNKLKYRKWVSWLKLILISKIKLFISRKFKYLSEIPDVSMCRMIFVANSHFAKTAWSSRSIQWEGRFYIIVSFFEIASIESLFARNILYGNVIIKLSVLSKWKKKKYSALNWLNMVNHVHCWAVRFVQQ